MASAVLAQWMGRIKQDFEPLPGRLSSTLRIVLASIITLLLLMTLRMPFAGLGMYFIFLIGRDSPAVSLRSGFLILLTLAASVATVLAVVIVSDNDPLARLLSVSIIVFLAGMLMLSTTLPTLGSVYGFMFCTLIALWETSTPAGLLVKQMLYLIGTMSLSVGTVIAVEYIFANKHPAQELHEETVKRYQLLEEMFLLYARGADPSDISPAVIRVSRLAATGQDVMQKLFNLIVERNLDTGVLPIGTRVRITMLAQLMDISAAFGFQYPSLRDPVLRQRCGHIAELCSDLAAGRVPPERQSELIAEHQFQADPTLLDRVDITLHSILAMPIDAGPIRDTKLAALPSSKVPIIIPGAYRQPETVAFALKLSLCATLCYIIYLSVAWPGISTAVTTVLIAGLSTSAATKQRLIFRLVGSFIGGLILAIGATAYLFPYMDSITSFVVLNVVVAMLAGWIAGGRFFSYVGLQIAFSYYLVVFEGFHAPIELAPARDRLIGILLALVIMAFVFDQIWPVRTVTVMRASLATILRGGARFLRLPETSQTHAELMHRADGFRDQLGKTMAGIRTMNDTIDYEFGVDRTQHKNTGEIILRAGLAAVAFFWNQFVVLHSDQDPDFLTNHALRRLRSGLADGLDTMAQSVTRKSDFAVIHPENLIDLLSLTRPRYREYVQHSIARFGELQNLVIQLRSQP